MTLPPPPPTMRAWVARRYGGPDLLRCETLPTPVPGPQDLLIRVEATTVSSGDRRIRAMDFPPGMKTLGRLLFGLRGPRHPVLGTECCGSIAAVGPKVTRFRVGDAVIAFPDARGGAHAEYLRMPESGLLTLRPADLAPELAASLCFGGLTAMSFLDRAGLETGERILVIGASGTVGNALLQLAILRGAQVTAVTGTAHVAQVAELGPRQVVDYTKQDFMSCGPPFDVVADAVGVLGFQQSLALLAGKGRHLAINGGLRDMLTTRSGTRRCIAGPASSSQAALDQLVSLAAAGHFRPWVDSVTPFDDLPRAHERADSGHKRGSAVVRVS